MKTQRRAMESLRKSKKESTSYLITLILSAALLFLFINIQNDPNLMSQNDTSSNLILGGFTLLIAVICAINCYVANTYFLKSKNQELCVYLTCGMKITVLAKFLIMQNMILLMFALPIGAILGMILNPIMNLIIFAITGLSGTLFTINLQGMLTWLLVLFFEMFFLILINVGYTYTNELKHMLDENSSIKLPDTRTFKIPSILYAFIGVLAIAVLLFVPAKANFLSIGAVLGFLSIKGMITLYIPKLSEKKKKKHKHLHCETMIIDGNVNALMKTSFMYSLMIAGTLILICLIAAGETLTYLHIILLIAYTLSVLLMGASIYFKILIEANNRKQEYHQLTLLGMNADRIKHCVRKEISKFYGYLILFPLPFAGIICIRFIISGQMSIVVPIYIFAVLVGYFILLMMMSIRAYDRCVLPEEMKEEESHA